MEARVRWARAEDEASWRALWAEFIVGGPEPCADEAPDAIWRGAMGQDHPFRLLIAADDRDQPVGFLLFLTHPWPWSPRSVAYLLDLYVAPHCRGRGLGRALIERLAEIGREAGWLKIYWMTQPENAAAHRLYEKVAVRSPLVRYDMMLNPH